MKKLLAGILIAAALMTAVLPVSAFALYEEDCMIDKYGDDVTPGVVTCTTQSINLRAQPNLDGRVLSTMEYEDEAAWWGKTSMDERGVTWYYVSWMGVQGWVSSKYTTLLYCN